MQQKNQYFWRTSCQIPIHELYARKQKLVLVTITIAQQYHFPHMHNCTSMLVCQERYQSKKPKSVCNKNQEHKDIQRCPVYLTEYDHDL